MNPASEWREVTCKGPFPATLNMPSGTLTIFRNRQGEATLDRPTEGVCSSTAESDPQDFAKQYQRIVRLSELQQRGLASPPSSNSLPAISGPSEASQLLLDKQMLDMQLESDLNPLSPSQMGPPGGGDDGWAHRLPHLPEPEPEPEPQPGQGQEQRDSQIEDDIFSDATLSPVVDLNSQDRRVVYMRGTVHHLGQNLWVGGIPDGELELGPTACENALRQLFSRFGIVEKVTVREKYNDPDSGSPVGRQSWAIIGFAVSSHEAVDRALADKVILNEVELWVNPLVVKPRLLEPDHQGALGEKWIEHNIGPVDPKINEYSQIICCARKSIKTGRWSCDWCGGRKKKNGMGAVSKKELEAVFCMFDQDGNGAIDKMELTLTMRDLAKAGRMAQPSDAQIDEMMQAADGDGDGEIDFTEFCDLITECDLHPTTCTRCENSQYLLTEDFYFGEPRPADPNAPRPETFRARMAARDEKLVHMSFAMVSAGSTLQTIHIILGALFWLSLSDQRDDTQYALTSGAVSIVMAAFACTIGCASRPVVRGLFVIYALWEIAVIITTVILMRDVQDSAEHCELSPGDGQAAIPTSDVCPQLIISSSTVESARAMCANSATEGFCEWSDVCSMEKPQVCTSVLPSGTCMLAPDNKCVVADGSTPFYGNGLSDLWGACGPTTGCRYSGFLLVVGWSLCILAFLTLMAIAYILNDSRFPIGLQLGAREHHSMWTVAMQMSLDPTVHSKKALGTLSDLYGNNVQFAMSNDGSGIFGAVLGDSRQPAEVKSNADGTLSVQRRGLGM